MNAPSFHESRWSAEIPFDQRALARVPITPGVYQILQNAVYPRYKGSTRILKIGMSRVSLRKEIGNHFNKHTAANRLKRICRQNTIITVTFLELASHDVSAFESRCLRDFEVNYWDLPLLNSTRGFLRGSDGIDSFSTHSS